MASEATIAIARDIRRSLAGTALTERQAKLYSQRLRRDMGRDGLAGFGDNDVFSYLDEAILLLECAFLERKADPGSAWRDGVMRAAEILEWLSQPSLKPQGTPLHLLAAAAYQVAGYPAMALGHLRRTPENEALSTILREFLRANFPDALVAVAEFWRDQRILEVAGRLDDTDVTIATFKHIVMCIGTVCSYLRSGIDGTTERALEKLDLLASSLLHSRDPYSYLLARLTAAASRRFVERSLWSYVDELRAGSSESAADALIQFARSAYVNRRALIWPAQAAGIQRLRDNNSFVLCTPTGSGKTTVATIAVIQGLFADRQDDPFAMPGLEPGNIVLYLVPSRALAAEVESRLAEDLKGLAADPITVTGLYGGVDWGPTDAWVQTARATIVICTYEKADALLRYLGVLFLHRVRLVVIDEAHTVEQSAVNLAGLDDASSRSFRLEQLASRLLRARDDYGFRMLALSAVAARAAPALARWINGSSDAVPASSSYRSTRQMLGRLEVNPTGNFSIRYDLMDGRSLKFRGEHDAELPFVPGPFPPMPGQVDPNDGPEVRMRGPTLWAALQLAAERPDGSRPSVLISLTQSPEAFSSTCANFLDQWPREGLPNYWSSDAENDPLWSRCLASAIDYFGENSVEYRLLSRGIAVHHGKMPGLLARRLHMVINRGYVRVIIATSTLSEGVNIPVNFVLIPSVCRGSQPLSVQEFTNLIGRAGRPGVATEGSALVVLPERTSRLDRYGRLVWERDRQWDGYERLVTQISETVAAAGEGAPEDAGSSPLAHLLRALEAAWVELSSSEEPQEFADWLEQTAVEPGSVEPSAALKYLDTLDGFLIAAIQELEELRASDLTPEQTEAELTSIWRRTYAFAADREEARLRGIWLTRGRIIKFHYPDAANRRRIYKTSLAPRSAKRLLSIADNIRLKLIDGSEYARLSTEERFQFVCDVLALLSQVPSFQISTKLGRRRNFHDWPLLLRWWLAKVTLAAQPSPDHITAWYSFVAQNFIYRGAWGLGSVLGLVLEDGSGDQAIHALEISDWPRSGLPWIAFWLKELITWGTLDPVAAYLLARGDAIDRTQAEAEAQGYYATLQEQVSANDALDPRRIREWVEMRRVRVEDPIGAREFIIEADLARPAADYNKERLTVMPIDLGDGLVWIDPAGYTVARSEKPFDWPEAPSSFDFELRVEGTLIVGDAYLRHL